MKVIGLIGGMSWESSIKYYELCNLQVRALLGGHHSAKCIMYSVDFAEIEALQAEGKWREAGEILAEVAVNLERGGAELVVLCTNTMHKVADAIQAAVPDIPFIHIAAATATAVKAGGIKKIGLLGTRYTMEKEFYKGVLEEEGLEVVVPRKEHRDLVHGTIYGELVLGKVEKTSEEAFGRVIDELVEEGAEGVILGCTEIGLLVKEAKVPIFDTTEIHARAAVEAALETAGACSAPSGDKIL